MSQLTESLTNRMTEVASLEFRTWLRRQPDALPAMLHAPMMEALEAAFAMGMWRGMVMAGEKLKGGDGRAGSSPDWASDGPSEPGSDPAGET